MKTPKLLPCPFCGHDDAEIVEVQSNWKKAKVIVCRCGAEGPTHAEKADAIKAWNTRTARRIVWDEEPVVAATWSVGDRVMAGAGEDHDHGTVENVDGRMVTVAWDSLVKTTTEDPPLVSEEPDCEECGRAVKGDQ